MKTKHSKNVVGRKLKSGRAPDDVLMTCKSGRSVPQKELQRNVDVLITSKYENSLITAELLSITFSFIIEFNPEGKKAGENLRF